MTTIIFEKDDKEYISFDKIHVNPLAHKVVLYCKDEAQQDKTKNQLESVVKATCTPESDGLDIQCSSSEDDRKKLVLQGKNLEEAIHVLTGNEISMQTRKQIIHLLKRKKRQIFRKKLKSVQPLAYLEIATRSFI